MALRQRHVWMLVAVVAALVGLGSYGAVVLLGRVAGAPPATLTVEASRPDGGAPSDAELDRTRSVLLARLKAAKLDRPQVSRSGERRLVLRARKTTTGTLRDLTASGLMRMRRVAASVSEATLTSAGPLPTASAGGAAVAERLGPAFSAAAAVTTPDEARALPGNVLDAFAALTPAEVATLPPTMQLLVPTVDCGKLGGRPVEAVGAADRAVVACDVKGVKYLLDPAGVTAADVASAKAAFAADFGSWLVTVRFTAAGQDRFTALTRQLAPQHEQLAIVLDTRIVSTPTIQDVIPGDAQIGGTFTQAEASLLAAQLSGGDLPVRLTPA